MLVFVNKENHYFKDLEKFNKPLSQNICECKIFYKQISFDFKLRHSMQTG